MGKLAPGKTGITPGFDYMHQNQANITIREQRSKFQWE